MQPINKPLPPEIKEEKKTPPQPAEEEKKPEKPYPPAEVVILDEVKQL